MNRCARRAPAVERALRVALSAGVVLAAVALVLAAAMTASLLTAIVATAR